MDLETAVSDPLVIGGRKVDGRTIESRRFRTIANDLTIQLARNPSAAERVLLLNAATLAMLCEGFTTDLLEGKSVADREENYRRNVQALGGLLVKLGMAAKSRDITKRDRAGLDDFGAALIEANAR